MQVEVVESDKEKLKIELRGESQTLSQLIATEIWELDGEASAFQEHPFMESPKIFVKGSSPKKLLEKAASKVMDEAEEFKEKFTKAFKK